MKPEELTTAEQTRFAEYLESLAAETRGCAAAISTVFEKSEGGSTSDSLAAVRKLNAVAMGCDVVARTLMATSAERAVDPEPKT